MADRTEFQKKTDAERERIDSMLAGPAAFWVVGGILAVLFVGSIIGAFL